MKKILIVQPSLQPPGGGNCVAAWMLEGLKAEHAVSVLTWTPLDFAEINRYFGTSLGAAEFENLLPNSALRRLLDALPLPLGLLKMNLLLRHAKRIGRDFDILMTINNEADFGAPGIQYVHFPMAYWPRPAADLRWYHAWVPLLKTYYRCCWKLSDFSLERLKDNVTLANSDWTAGKIREFHGIDSITLYPPITGGFPEVPWSERENGFVCIGRFSPEKDLDKIINILAAVKVSRPETHLHLIGAREARANSYYSHVRRRVAENASWISLHENMSRTEMAQLIARHRYGIHGMIDEHFGMAVAEMVRGGCIVFIPRGGGQIEIVGGDERVLYGTTEEAVKKIAAMLDDAGRQFAVRKLLEKRVAQFSTEQFIEQLRVIVRDFARCEPAVGSPSA